jgi:hypothetical protein
MYFGVRPIRSAGRTSGSIEITLPAQLQFLEGIDCRLVVRDSGQPEIVLQPDLSVPHRLIKDLWQKLRLGLGSVGDVGEFAMSDYTLVLFQPDHWQERPPLIYSDALKVLTNRSAHGKSQSESLASLVASLAIVAAQRLGLGGALALAFGEALTYLVTGNTAGLGADFERGMAYQMLEQMPSVKGLMGSPLDDSIWAALRPVVRQVYEQFQEWQADPASYAAARENWFRAFDADVSLNTSSVAGYVELTGRLSPVATGAVIGAAHGDARGAMRR